MLVGPSGVAASGLRHFENGVGEDRIVRVFRNALASCVDVPGQCRRIDHVQRNRRVARVLVDRFVIDLHIAGLSEAGSVRWIKNAASKADIVEKPVADWGATGY